MNRSEITSFLPDTEICRTNLGGQNYHVPTLAWAKGPCYTFFLSRYWSEGEVKWSVRDECRDFARRFAAIAVECWDLTGEISSDDALAIGEMWFIPNADKSDEGHAVCPIFTENGLQFIEPQTGNLYPMTAEQIASRYFLRF